jgi:MoaA/NifB/PqqE/SkfB family radical SAM enzyme
MNLHKALTILTHPLKGHATATFAVTNRCNGRCGFCSIWCQTPAEPISPVSMNLALRKLHQLGIRYIQFTGGEPLLYPHLDAAIRLASDLGILPTVVTNGSLLTQKIAEQLREADVGEVQVSVDHYDGSIMERNRGIPQIREKLERGVQHLRALGIPVSASTTISRLLTLEGDDFRKLLEYCQRLGFRGVYFCHPMREMESTYTLGGNGDLVTYSRGELREILTHLLELKRAGYAIDNSVETIQVGLAYLQGRRSNYPCLGGYKTFYLDWNLDLFRCMRKGDLIGPLLELDTENLKLERVECDDCLISCMREPSIYFHGPKSIVPMLRLALRLRYVDLKTWR